MSQITIDPSIALGLPLDITNPIEITGATPLSLVYGTAFGALTSLGAATDGQIPIGDTGGIPILSTLTAGENINITNAAGSITIAAPGDIGPTFPDDTFQIYDSTVPTAILDFDCGAIAAGNERTVTMCDYDIDLREVATTITTNAGNATPAIGTLNIVGAGAVTTEATAADTVTITSNSLVWTEIAVDQVAEVNNGYICNDVGLITITLPAVAAVGDIIEVVGHGAGGWRVAQQAGQIIRFANISTTLGIVGTISSTIQYNCAVLICVTANTEFVIIRGVGSLRKT